MKLQTILCTAVAILFVAGGSAYGQERPEDLFQSGLYQQEVAGDLEAAIGIYSSIVRDFPQHRGVSARALLQMGRAHETRGSEEAQLAFERLLRDYSDQQEPAAEARAHLVRIRRAVLAETREEGFRIRNLWDDDQSSHVQSLSPDGRYVAFVDWVSVDGNADLTLFDIRTGERSKVTHRPSWDYADTYVGSPIWSATGTQLAYNLWNDSWSHQALHVVRPDGTGDRVLVANDQYPHISPMAWSKRGDFIVCLISGWDDIRRIATVSVEDGSVRILKTLGEHNPWPLSLSPDGKYIVYDYHQDDLSEKHDIFMLATDGSSEVLLVSHPADDEVPFWTPDGDRIVFLSDRSGRRSLWTIRVEAGGPQGKPELVRSDVGPISPLGFSQDGSLYYRSPVRVSDLHLAEFDLAGRGSLGTPVPLTERFVGTNRLPTWSPDGGRIAYLSSRGTGGFGDPHLVVKRLDTGEERDYPLSFSMTRNSTSLSWSSDGGHVLIGGGTSFFVRQSYRVDLVSGDVIRESYLRDQTGFGEGPGRFASGVQEEFLRSEGLRLIGQRDRQQFESGDASPRPDEELLWIRNGVSRITSLARSEIERLVPGGHMHAWELSPDGTRIAFSIGSDSARLVSDVLHVMPISGGAARELARVVGDQAIIMVRWMPDGESLLYEVASEESPDDDQIWWVSAAGETPRRLEIELDRAEFWSLTFAPDGHQIVYSTQDRHGEMWMIEGFSWQSEPRP